MIDKITCEQCGEVRKRFYRVISQIILCEFCAQSVLPAMCRIMKKQGLFDNGKFPVEFVDAEGDENDLN